MAVPRFNNEPRAPYRCAVIAAAFGWLAACTAFGDASSPDFEGLDASDLNGYYAYVTRLEGRGRVAFGSSDTVATAYSTTDVEEFFAEGYAVFYGGDGLQRARRRNFAPEL